MNIATLLTALSTGSIIIIVITLILNIITLVSIITTSINTRKTNKLIHTLISQQDSMIEHLNAITVNQVRAAEQNKRYNNNTGQH